MHQFRKGKKGSKLNLSSSRISLIIQIEGEKKKNRNVLFFILCNQNILRYFYKFEQFVLQNFSCCIEILLLPHIENSTKQNA